MRNYGRDFYLCRNVRQSLAYRIVAKTAIYRETLFLYRVGIANISTIPQARNAELWRELNGVECVIVMRIA